MKFIISGITASRDDAQPSFESTSNGKNRWFLGNSAKLCAWRSFDEVGLLFEDAYNISLCGVRTFLWMQLAKLLISITRVKTRYKHMKLKTFTTCVKTLLRNSNCVVGAPLLKHFVRATRN